MTTALVAAGGQVAATMSQQVGALDRLVDLLSRLEQARILPNNMSLNAAVVAACAGARFGWDPMKSVGAFYVVNGRAAMSAVAMQAVCLSHPDCEYFTCIETTNQIATYEAKRRSAPNAIRISFTMEDALRAKLSGGSWEKFPAQMLVARCTSRLARAVFPDALHGMYTREELTEGRSPDDDDIIDAQVIETTSHHAPQPERVRQSTPPQRQKPTAAAEVGTYEWLARRVRRAALEVPLNAYFRAKEADPDKAQTLESIRAWNSTDRWGELAEQIAAALPANLNAPRVAYDTAKLHLSKVLGRPAEAAEISALMQRVREACEGVAELSARNLALACCLLAARCVRKPATLHLRLGLPKAGE